ncbi:MFS general substrate transporter [Microthyrium microscopicum]|uniref:MFS general substrate transporter n=1 Tax=Microthyrium microscopicum TaxID=703497 RepID=A0A6A6U0N4_9PEZI|nr:MFS general substrate transporter [Microthyrium microscopicum]
MTGESRGPIVLVVTAVILILSTLFVLLRLISKFGVVRRVAWDDYFMILAWFLAFGLSFAICYGTRVGLGMHENTVPQEWQSALKKSEFAFSVLYNPALMATKTSILTFYLSLSHGNKFFRYSTFATLAVVNIAGIALTFLNIFQCRPMTAIFKTPVPATARCTDIVTLYLSSAPANIITDLAILFLPMPILTAMRLPRKQKTILVITFGFGFFVAVVDVIRIIYLQDASLNRLEELTRSNGATSTLDQRDQTDVSWYASLSFMWSAIEVNVGIMCANVPGLKPLVSRFMPYILRDKGDQSMSANGPEKITSLDRAHQRLGSDATPAAPAAQESEAQFGSAQERPYNDMIDMMDFLTTPDMAELPSNLRRPPTAVPTERAPSRGPQTFFDFVVVEQKKSMVKLTNRESLFPIAMVTVLFFLWGVAYGFLDTLNARFQSIAHMTQAQSVGIHSAYFGAYSVGTLTVGRLILKHFGFKACYVAGLCLYGCGTLVFWPSAVLSSFPAFLISNFMVGMGLSLLEIAANPFVALCGPQEWMELRLNLSQGIQAIGTVFSPLLASKVLFKETTSAPSLIDVQWTYLGIALFTIVLAVAYFYLPLPEATDDELEEAAEHPDLLNLTEIRGTRLVLITLIMGCICMFCYVGAQEAISTTFPQYIKLQLKSRGELLIDVGSTEFLAIGHSTFAAGRFLAAFLNLFIKPRILLLIFFLGAVITSALAMRLDSNATEAVVLLLYFFEGPIFAFIYGMSLRGLGRHTKDGAALITASISGGGVFPPILYGVAGGNPAYFQGAYRVIVAAFAIGMLFPLYLNFFPLARRIADPVRKSNGLPRHDRTSTQPPAFGRMSNSSGRPSSNLEVLDGSKMAVPMLSMPKPPVLRTGSETTSTSQRAVSRPVSPL